MAELVQRHTEVLFDPFPKQIELLDAIFSKQYTIVLFGGAIKGGKTFGVMGALIMLCKLYPGSRWCIVRKDLQTIKLNTLPTWEKIRPQNFIGKTNLDTFIAKCGNGSEIIFFGENFDKDKDLNRWKGLDVNGFILEEINELQEQTLDKAIERAGTWILPEWQDNPALKPPPLIMATCNPTKNWVKKKFHDPWKKGVLPAYIKYIPSKITDNPFYASDKVYMDNLKTMRPNQYKMYVEGDWEVKLEGCIFDVGHFTASARMS